MESLQAHPSFRHVANQVGNFGSYSSLPYDAGGMSFRDYHNDAWDDLTYCTGIGSPIKIFKNNFGIFEEVTTITTNTEMHYYSSWLDYDNDNDLDLFTISSLGGVELFQNNGSYLFSAEQPDQILAFIDVVPDTNLMGARSITLDIIGGTPPYTAVWSDSLNQTGEIASNLVKGAYTAKITDSQFCERLLNIVVPNVTVAGLAMIKPQADKLECLHIDGNIHIQLDRAIDASDNVLESIFLYDVSGRKIAFDYTAVGNRTLVLSFNASGVFILRDEFTQQSCKVIKL